MVSLTNSLYHAGSSSTSHAKGHTTILHVRTRDIQLDSRNMLQRIHTSSTLCIILWRGTTDIHNIIALRRQQLGINMLTEIIHALILQAYAVQHTLWRLCHSRIVIALTRFQCSTLYYDTTNTFKIYKILELQTIAKRTRGSHHRVLHFQSPNIYF